MSRRVHSAQIRRQAWVAVRPSAGTCSRLARQLAHAVLVLLAVTALSVPTKYALADNKSPKSPAKVRDITFDHIKLNIKKGDPFERTMLTPEVKKLDGQPVRLAGYILPAFTATGLKQFVLVRDNLECCFGPGAALFDCVLVEMVEGTSANYSVRPVRVEGVFTVKELKGPDGKHLAIYHMDGREVKQP